MLSPALLPTNFTVLMPTVEKMIKSFKGDSVSTRREDIQRKGVINNMKV